MRVGAKVFAYANPSREGTVISVINAEAVLINWGDATEPANISNICEIIAPWRNISVEPFSVMINGRCYSRTPKCNWCNADSVVKVTRTSNLSDHTYSDYACEECAKPWREAMRADSAKESA